MPTPPAVARLERDLREGFGARLRSLVIYGRQTAAAPPSHGVREDPIHTLAIVEALTREDLASCASRAAAWHEEGLATPLILAASEFERSLDAFPIEFGGIVADHVLVAGRPPFEQAQVDPADLRRACEVQARSHLLHLREGYIETRGRADALADLIARSAPPCAALLRSIATLQGLSAADPAAAARHAERTLGVPPGALADVTRVAGTEIASGEAVRMFPLYLDAVERLVAFVDGWSRP